MDGASVIAELEALVVGAAESCGNVRGVHLR